MKQLRFFAFIVGVGIALRTFGIYIGERSISLGFVSSTFYFILLWNYCQVKQRVSMKNVVLLYGKRVYLPLIYCLILFFSNVLNYNSAYGIGVLPLSFFLCYLLFLAFLLHACFDSFAPTSALLGFLFGTIILSICFYLNIGVDRLEFGSGGLNERFSVFGVNCNELGLYCSLGVLILLNEFVLKKTSSQLLVKIPSILLGILLLSLIIATASRSAFIGLILGLIITFIFFPTKRRSTKILILILTFAIFVIVFLILVNSELYIIMRLLESVETGDSSNRSEIIVGYFPYVWEHPFWGVGDTGLIEVSRAAFNEISHDSTGEVSAVSPHNVLLESALTTGLVGLSVMILFWFYAGKRAYNQYIRYKRLTPIVSVAPLLISILFGHILTDKFGWLLYAYMIVYCNPQVLSKIGR